MSGSHKEFPKKAVSIQLGLAALVGIGFLAADKPAAHASADKVAKPIVVAAAKVLAPIGKVEVKEASMASAARSGEEIYGSTCGVCHDNGVAGAPKLDDKGTWETRLDGGFTGLVASAIKGKGGMPARGGDPDITDSEMELVVSHMIKKAGIELVARSANTTSAAPAVSEKQALAVKADVAPKTETVVAKVEETKDAVVEKAEEIVTPVTETVEKVAIKVEEKVETVAEVVEEKVETMTNAVEEKVETVVAKTEAMKTEAVTAVAAATETVDHSAGEAIYKSSCFACHDSGVAGSPKIGDKAAWTARIATGTESLYEAAIKGKGAMPGKGGNMSIADADVKAAVDYMVSESK